MFDIKEALKNLPDRPGVYIMHRGDTVLYVGKAVNLKNRVSQYFRPGADGRINAQRMVEKVDWFEYIVTDNEMEAFILENNLIKEHRPPYNILLKDDKRYYKYNPLKELYGRCDEMERFRDILQMLLGDCVKNFEMLPIVQDADIIRNVLCFGVWTKFNRHYNIKGAVPDGTGSL